MLFMGIIRQKCVLVDLNYNLIFIASLLVIQSHIIHFTNFFVLKLFEIINKIVHLK